ncbi:MAG: retropepsin-like domain-containing protein [Chitinophagaceae bacterium]|nr:retropepsin-like domain-containing protein [Chitinophagaceae bacterium]
MGTVYADIELINADDLALVRRHMMDKDEVKRIVVNMLVDSGAYMMAINESIQEQLDLPFIDTRKSIMADGSIVEHRVVGPIIVKFKNRTTTCNALVLPGNTEPLLGAISQLVAYPAKLLQVVHFLGEQTNLL